MPGMQERYTPAEVIAALTRCKGRMFLTADQLGMHYNGLLKFIKRHPEVAKHVKQVKGARTDEVEDCLVNRCQKGDTNAIKFYLLTQGRDRGYSYRPEPQENGQQQQNQGVIDLDKLDLPLSVRLLILEALQKQQSKEQNLNNPAPLPVPQLAPPPITEQPQNDQSQATILPQNGSGNGHYQNGNGHHNGQNGNGKSPQK